MALRLGRLLILAIVVILVALAATLYLYFAEGTPPRIIWDTSATHAGKQASFALEVTDKGRGLRNLMVLAVQGENRITLLDTAFPPDQYAWSGAFALPEKGLRDGPLDIIIQATDRSLASLGAGNSTVSRHQLLYDATPPRIAVQSDAHNLNQGGAGLVVYTLSEEVASSGVLVEDVFFPGYRQASGVYYCLFAIPYNVDPAGRHPALTATDLAGNTTRTGFFFHGNRRMFRRDTLNISDAFLENVMPQFQNAFPDEDNLLDLYLLVNRELRAENIAFLQSLAETTAPSPLWNEVFLRQPRSAPRAGYADHRTYIYRGDVIDQQVHMGIDLASTANDPILTANRGTVIFTGDLGIYGQTVILDHGLGLHTLYAHLSQIQATEGAMLEKGDLLGRSGMTGLAAGDHLHFEVLVSGVSVNPIEWWDKQWLRHNFWSKTAEMKN